VRAQVLRLTQSTSTVLSSGQRRLAARSRPRCVRLEPKHVQKTNKYNGADPLLRYPEFLEECLISSPTSQCLRGRRWQVSNRISFPSPRHAMLSKINTDTILTSKYNKVPSPNRPLHHYGRHLLTRSLLIQPFPVTLLPSAIGYYLGMKQGERQAQVLNEIRALAENDIKTVERIADSPR